MEGSHLLRLYKSLAPDTRLAFRTFVGIHLDPLKKGDAKVLALLEILHQNAPDFDPVRLDKNAVSQKLFPQSPKGSLEKLMVEANKLLKRFLLQEKYASPENGVRQELDWIEVLQNLGLADLKVQAIHRLQKEISGKKDGGPADLYHRFLLEWAKAEHESANNRLKGDLNVPNTLKALNRLYHFHRLEMLNQYLLQQRVANLEIPESVGRAAEIQIWEGDLDELPLLIVANQIFRLLQHPLPSIEDFKSLAELLKTHEERISPEWLKHYYAYLRNFCTLLINAGAVELLPAYHQLQMDNLERGYFYHAGNRISASAYISVVIGAIRAKNEAWAKHFIEDHRGRVIGETPEEDLFRLNTAQYYFAVGQYQEALDRLPQTLEYLNYALLAKRLELKALYELSSELLPYKAAAFKTYISRASDDLMPPALRKINRIFVNLLLQLLNSPPRDRERSLRLIRRIEEKEQVAEREWLLEKALKL